MTVQSTDNAEKTVVQLDRGPAGDRQTELLSGSAEGSKNEFLVETAIDILDKQYRLYTWNDAKTVALITTNSVLFAAIGFLYKECLRETAALMLLGCSTFFVGISLSTCLIQVIPRLTSGQSGGGLNTRSLRGISLHSSWSEYFEAFKKLQDADLLRDTVRQIYGMCKNNIRSRRIILAGVVFTLFGIFGILGAAGVSALAARGHPIYGPWEPNKVAPAPEPPRVGGKKAKFKTKTSQGG